MRSDSTWQMVERLCMAIMNCQPEMATQPIPKFPQPTTEIVCRSMMGTQAYRIDTCKTYTYNDRQCLKATLHNTQNKISKLQSLHKTKT